MPNYRNYGYLAGANAPQGSEVNLNKRTQVYLATHESGSADYLSYMNRSFISFSYGSKNIEDFNLIAITEGNNLNRQAYANFVDNVTASEIYDGQLFWSTHFNNNQLSLTLATDGMTEENLNDFQEWFKPGQEKELILAEHPNRAILARIAEPPHLNLLPFETEMAVKIANTEYNTSTTLYKGQITLAFTMDSPFWYSKVNILDALNVDGTYRTGIWMDANNQEVDILTNKDALKIIQEDRVPTATMISPVVSVPMIFGDKPLIVDQSGASAIVGLARVGQARIGHAVVSTSLHLDQSAGDNIHAGYFYYGGTAPCAPIIIFSLTPIIDSDSKKVRSPINTLASSTKAYNTITIESVTKQEFKFTTPSIYTAYNQVINILDGVGTGVAWETVREILRNHVKHYAPRAYAMALIGNRSGTTTSSTITSIKSAMPKFFYSADEGTGATPAPITLIFNSYYGTAHALVSYRSGTNKSTYIEDSIENVGDMVRSNYLIITDRNKFSDDGYVRIRTDVHPEYSHRIYTDVEGGISNLVLQYKYMYL